MTRTFKREVGFRWVSGTPYIDEETVGEHDQMRLEFASGVAFGFEVQADGSIRIYTGERVVRVVIEPCAPNEFVMRLMKK